jgi:hypothetical protein
LKKYKIFKKYVKAIQHHFSISPFYNFGFWTKGGNRQG